MEEKKLLISIAEIICGDFDRLQRRTLEDLMTRLEYTMEYNPNDPNRKFYIGDVYSIDFYKDGELILSYYHQGNE